MSKIDTNSQGCGIPECADPAFPADGEKSVWHAPQVVMFDIPGATTKGGSNPDSATFTS